jgi:hypothetical protein
MGAHDDPVVRHVQGWAHDDPIFLLCAARGARRSILLSCARYNAHDDYKKHMVINCFPVVHTSQILQT